MSKWNLIKSNSIGCRLRGFKNETDERLKKFQTKINREIFSDITEERKRVEEQEKNICIKVNEIEMQVRQLADKDISKGLDYLDFENHFRGPEEQIKKVLSIYLPYFVGRKNVIELGSGRGEFLELMRESDIGATGVDISDHFIHLCRQKELNVVKKDALTFLRNLKSSDGIFSAQMIEHLSMNDVIELCKISFEKLEKGAYLVLETPNPFSLSIFTHAFYMDPSHIKPVHPLTLQYIAEKAGFEKVDLLFTETSKYPVTVPELIGTGLQNADEFNKSMKIIESTLFGSQDYALIARK